MDNLSFPPFIIQRENTFTTVSTSDGCLHLNIPFSDIIQIAWNNAEDTYKTSSFELLQINSISAEDSFADNSTHREDALKYLNEKNEVKMKELMVNLYNSAVNAV